MVQLVGLSAGTPVSGEFPDGSTIIEQAFVATASGTVTSASFYFFATFGVSRSFVIVIYDNAGNRIATSNTGTTGTTEGWKTATFTGGPSITAGTTYRLALFPNGYLDFGATGTGEVDSYENGLTYPTVPDPYSSNGSNNPGILFIYLDGTASGSSGTANPGVGAVQIQGRAATMNPFTNVRIREVFINEAGSPVTNKTGMQLLVWYGGSPVGAPDLSYSNVTTDPAGTMSWSLATGTLAYNQSIFYVATDGGASLSMYTCARMTPTYS